MRKVRALICGILENKRIGNCSNDGISNRFNDVYVVCPDGNWEFDLDNPDEIPENLVMLEMTIFGGRDVYKKFVPYKYKDKWGMMGGAFVYSNDARFHDNFGSYPIPLHDRYEF